MSPNCLVARAPPRTALWELTLLTQNSSLVGRGYEPPPQKRHPLRGAHCGPPKHALQVRQCTLMIYTVSQNVTTLSHYNSDIHESILIICGKNVTEKPRCFIFPLHLTSAFALPGKMKKDKITTFHLKLMYCCIKSCWLNYGRPMEQGRPLYFHPIICCCCCSSSFSSPNLSRRRLDACHTSTHGVALVRI